MVMFLKKCYIWVALAAAIFFCWTIKSYANDIERVKIHLNDDQIAMSFINLPDGEATLIQSNHKNILINTGEKGSQAVIKNQLRTMGINKINILVLTNPQPSYIGNVEFIIRNYDTKEILTSNDIKRLFCSKTKSLCKLFVDLDQKELNLLPNLKMEVLEKSKHGESNLSLTYGNTTIYYMGFSDPQNQQEMLEYPFHAAIVKLSHFGEGIEMNNEFLDALDPEMAVIFHKNGVKPNESFMNHLATEWVETYHLQDVGTLTLYMTRESYEIAPFFKD